MTDGVQLSITLLHSGSHFPGDQVKGQVSVISTVSTRITNLRLVWSGIVTTEMNTTRDENILFHEVWYLDPKDTSTFVLSSPPSSPHQVKVKKGIKDYSFDLYLKQNIPSSFEMNETVSLAKVEYTLEAWADVDSSAKPKRERIYIPVLATQYHQNIDAEEQQTHDATYIVTIPEVDNREYRTAARITVPCKIVQRGVALPIVAHIWHDRDCTRPGGITLSLLRITTINSQHRQSTLISEVETTTLDLKLARRPEYSVQTLSESLRIPSTTLPSLDQSIGRLIMIEYRISLKVTIHDNAIYRLSEDESIAPNMLVSLPLTIDSNPIPEPTKSPSTSSLSSLGVTAAASTHSTGSSNAVSNRMRTMFRRTNTNLSRQTTLVSNRVTASDSFIAGKTTTELSTRSSSPSVSSITTDSLPTKPVPPPFTPATDAKLDNVKSTLIPEFDTGVYTFHIFEDSSDEEYVLIEEGEEEEEEKKPSPSSIASTPSSSPQKESPPQTPPSVTPPKIHGSSGDKGSHSQYWGGIFSDQDSDDEDNTTIERQNETKSPPTPMTPSTSNPLFSPPGPAAINQEQQQRDHDHNQVHISLQHTESVNGKLDFISESDTDEHSDDSDEEPDLLSVIARREQRIERQKVRTIPNA